MQRDPRKSIEVLVVDSDPTVRQGFEELLGPHGFFVTSTDSAEQGMAMLQDKFFAVVLCDLDTPGIDGGLEVVRHTVHHSPATTAIVLSPRRGWEAAVSAFRAGATDIIYKDREQIPYLVEQVVSHAHTWQRRRNRDELLLQVQEVHEEFLRRMRQMHQEVVDIQDRLQGRDVAATFQLPECHVLVVDDQGTVFEALERSFAGRDDGWFFHEVRTGGEALDIGGSERFHIALVKQSLPDLPGSLVTSTLRAQSPETIYLAFDPPGSPGAAVRMAESERAQALLDPFTDPAQLAGRLDEIRDAFKAKARARRALQSFRTVHYDFLKKYAELHKELQRAKKAMAQREAG